MRQVRNHRKQFTASLLVIALGCVASRAEASRNGVTNSNVQRKIDLASQFAKVATTYTVDGVGESYEFGVPQTGYDHLAIMTVSVGGEPASYERVQDGGVHEGMVIYKVDVDDQQDGLKITVKTVYTDVLQPFPKEITQLEDQGVVYETSMFAASPYKTSRQSTILKLASPQILDMTDAPGKRAVKGDQISYGPFVDITPFDAGSSLRVHYVNHSPFAKVTSCLREIEVSNWGNIAIEEHFELVHAGAKLKGGFSRMDYMSAKHDRGANPSFRALEATLPWGASDIYYRDNIGNISTSMVRSTPKSVEMTISSRFPMYGGWKNAWYQGYNLPTEEGLRHDGSHFTLELPFGPPFKAVWVEDLTVKVILPEGAHNIRTYPPFEVSSEGRTQRYTYLDTVGAGRPVVVLRMNNFVKEHNLPLKVTYDFNRARMLVEPLLLAGFFLACFLVAMFVGRLDMRIRKNGNRAAAS